MIFGGPIPILNVLHAMNPANNRQVAHSSGSRDVEMLIETEM